MSSSGRKRNKSWASRERAGMSFLFVLAFFAVFGIIILTQVRISIPIECIDCSSSIDTHVVTGICCG